MTTTPVDDLLKREGGPSNDPDDRGGETVFGISRVANPEAWSHGRPPTEAEARALYTAKYVIGPRFNQIPEVQLRNQLIDFGVTSGPAVAIQKLQQVLHVIPDGVLGPETLLALQTVHPRDVNNLLVAERIRMICRIVQKTPTQVRFLYGWADRALQFLE